MKTYLSRLLRVGLLLWLCLGVIMAMPWTPVAAQTLPAQPPPTIGAAVSTVISGFAPCYSGCGGVADPPTSSAEYEQEVVELVNVERWNNGQLPPLKQVDSLTNAARYHSNDLGQDSYFTHDTQDRVGGELTWVCAWNTRLSSYYSGGYMGENIAAGYSTPQAVMTGWMNSSGHRANILNANYYELGVGYAQVSGSDYGRYWTQDFGRRSGVYPIVINREAATTDYVQVNLYIYGAETWSEMRLRNNNDAWTDWQSFQTDVVWKLPATQGMHTVTVELRSGSNTTTSGDTIYLNWAAPTPPDPPSNLTVALAAQTAITLTWTDNSTDEAAFKIERSSNGVDNWFKVGSVVTDVTTYSDSPLTCETPYYYRVRAHNAAGDSDYSNVASGTTAACPLTIPAAPTDLVVTLVSQTAITLTWMDNSDNEAGFKIEQSPDGSSGWVSVGDVAAGVITFTDVGLTPSTPYFYRVVAYNAAGNSDYSNVATGTTDAPPPLSVAKVCDIGDLSRVPLGGVVTYTLTISNNTAEMLHNVVLTDSLPVAVTFRAWVWYTGSGILPPPGTAILPPLGVIWGPLDLAVGGVLTLTFSVNVTTSVDFAGDTVVNTAQVTADDAPPAAGSASFRVVGNVAFIYLPLVLRQ